MKKRRIFAFSLLLLCLIISGLVAQERFEKQQEFAGNVIYPNPTLDGIVIGNESAPVTMILYVNPNSVHDNLPSMLNWLRAEYVLDSRVQIFIKPILSKDEADTFINSQSTFCSIAQAVDCKLTQQQIRTSAFESDWFGIIGRSPVMYVGLRGVQNTVVVGIPSMEKMQDIIREKEILVGR